MCVQNFNDSRGVAIRITYRISLRSSSLWEPRHPLLKVVQCTIDFIRSVKPQGTAARQRTACTTVLPVFQFHAVVLVNMCHVKMGWKGVPAADSHRSQLSTTLRTGGFARDTKIVDLRCGNDPSAGSPTETLLRLHLPLNDKV